MTASSEPDRVAAYDGADFTVPGSRLWRTVFGRPRPLREQFAASLEWDPVRDAPPLESAARWGEHMLIEDIVAAQHRDGTVSTVRHVVTLLHGAEQLAAWDEVVRSYDTKQERHQLTKARLYLPEGRWVDARRSGQAYSTNGNPGNRNGITMIARYFPLRPGVIVELEEKFDSFQVDAWGPVFANSFFLRTAPPCRRRRYTVAAAKPFRLVHRTHHWDGEPVERDVGDYRVCTWEIHEAEGVDHDEWTPPLRDFGPWVDVTTVADWEPCARRLRGELETWSSVSADIVELSRELAAGKTTPLEKAVAAYSYVANSLRYGRPPDETPTRNSRSAELMIQDLRGDCKDKSALLVQLLRSMNFEASVAAVLTSDAGRTPFLPSARFNHALVRVEVDGRTYWLDAASGLFAFGDLPAQDLAVRALVLGRKGFHFEVIPLEDGATPEESRACTGRLTADGAYEFEVVATLRRESAARFRASLFERQEKQRLQALQSWLGHDFPGAAGHDFSCSPFDDLGAPSAYRCQARIARAARRIQDLYVLRLPWAGRLSMTGPLAAAERSEPMILPLAFHVVESHEIRLPDDVVPHAIPDPTACECPWGRYTARVEAVDGTLRCERRMQLMGETFVPPEQFGQLQQFWSECTWSDGAEVVLASRTA